MKKKNRKYTGFIDRKGKKIYEGDKVKCQSRKSGHYLDSEIVWSKDWNCWTVRGYKLDNTIAKERVEIII